MNMSIKVIYHCLYIKVLRDDRTLHRILWMVRRRNKVLHEMSVWLCTRLQLLLCLSIVKTFEVYASCRPRTFDRAHPVKIYGRICVLVTHFHPVRAFDHWLFFWERGLPFRGILFTPLCCLHCVHVSR